MMCKILRCTWNELRNQTNIHFQSTGNYQNLNSIHEKKTKDNADLYTMRCMKKTRKLKRLKPFVIFFQNRATNQIS